MLPYQWHLWILELWMCHIFKATNKHNKIKFQFLSPTSLPPCPFHQAGCTFPCPLSYSPDFAQRLSFTPMASPQFLPVWDSPRLYGSNATSSPKLSLFFLMRALSFLWNPNTLSVLLPSNLLGSSYDLHTLYLVVSCLRMASNINYTP